MIEIRGCTKRYGDLVAVDNLSLEVSDSEIFGFLGPNGAGKTTTIKVLAGLLPPTKGRVLVGGFDVVRQPMEAKAATGFIPDTPFLFEKLTGREFLRFVGRLYGLTGKEVGNGVDRQLNFFDLTNWADHLIESYSHGMKQRLIMSSALLSDPEVIIVDEPMVGLDPAGIKMVKDLFTRLAAGGVTIFMSTHTLTVEEDVCHRIGIIHKGALITTGTPTQLKQNSQALVADLEAVFIRLTEENES